MIKNRQNIIKLAKKFKLICEQNDIWYSIDKETLLGIVRHGGFVPWYEKFNILITVEGFNKLKRLVPDMIVDSSSDASYKSLSITFVNDKNGWQDAKSFLELHVAVPTTKLNIIKFSSINKRIWSKLTRKKDNIKHAINDLYEYHHFQGYLRLTKRKEYVEQDWIQTLSFKTITKEFNGVKFQIAKEYKSILENLFGSNYMDAKIPQKWYEYPHPIQRIEVKQ